MSKQTKLDQYGSPVKLHSRFMDTSDDEDTQEAVASPYKRPKDPDTTFQLPQLNRPVLLKDKVDYDTSGLKFNPVRTKFDKRAGKFDEMSKRIKPSNFAIEKIPTTKLSEHELSRFKQNLADILINGNLRIKFNPKCATRTGAKQYCESKVGDDGYPRYRLMGTNTQDPFGNDICDMNGDLVDDIIICDRKGNPVIINGYKLVQASPYKKIWMNIKNADPDNTPSFEKWLAIQFGTTKDWNKITNDDWERGKLEWSLDKNANTQAQNAYKTYKHLGLGKPRLNIRLSARALWSSVFSELLWKTNWIKYSFGANNTDFASLINLVDYLKLSNAVFLLYVEWPMCRNQKKTNWVNWVLYKQDNKKSVNTLLGQKVSEIRTNLLREISNGTDDDPNSEHAKIYQKAAAIIKAGFNVASDAATAKQLAAEAIETKISVTRRKQIREFFNTNVDNLLCSRIDGYATYLAKKQESRAKNPAYNSYMNMNWVNANNVDEEEEESQI